MRAEGCRFSFRINARVTRKVLLIFAALLSCITGLECTTGWEERPREDRVSFCVFDVGEGLAQMVQRGDTAVLFDMGPPEGFTKWKTQFESCGKPFVRAIVVSHDHLDHIGGLQLLDSGFAWTGLLVVSPYEDTSFIRQQTPPQWKNRIRFQTVAAYDTLALFGSIRLRCLWPVPEISDSSLSPDEFKNRYSLVFKITYGLTDALITSDIDTSAEAELSQRETSGSGNLSSSVMVVPHHGSAGSLDPVFYGYVHPSTAIISCGKENPYGHPSTAVLLWLSQMGTAVKLTSLNGMIILQSNGYGWN